ncbi:MAG: ABC transporter permease [Deltaproteobacteria bacterium]|nr:ABC transporter permease [Deltaproteobacteria bacterium]MBW1992985.1 ABC transporter permease [Deltaproteobacteria bacterium]MBW2153478.1 ABC transporter permease [Deltaproteobacteria bacterium]
MDSFQYLEAQTKTPSSVPLKVMLRRAERRRVITALALITPLFLFLLLTFVGPILSLLYRSVDNPEILQVLPRTSEAIRAWDGKQLPDETVYAALAADLREARKLRTLSIAAKRLNYDIVGFRSLMLRSARKLPKTDPVSYRSMLIEIDRRWGEKKYWAAIKRAASPHTSFYLLSAADLDFNEEGKIVRTPPDEALYIKIYLRTFWIAFVIMVVCVVLGYPLAYLLAHVPPRIGNLLMILVLLPFWTSLLVRTAAWVILLQREGIVNVLLTATGVTSEPIQLVFNRTGVYIAMVHILLPYMVLPIFSVMKGISPDYMRAAASLGAKPMVAFLRVYLPQTMPGIGAGCLLVYILAIGYYITPALVGGLKDQMISYFIAYFINTTINWGMAAALSAVLLALTLILYAAYNRLIGIERMKLG